MPPCSMHGTVGVPGTVTVLVFHWVTVLVLVWMTVFGTVTVLVWVITRAAGWCAA